MLRSNSGSVDATIDNLLKMSEGCADFVPYRDVALEIVGKADSEALRLHLHLQADLPPSYEQAVQQVDEPEEDPELEELPPPPPPPQAHRQRSGLLPALDLSRFPTEEAGGQVPVQQLKRQDRKSTYKVTHPFFSCSLDAPALAICRTGTRPCLAPCPRTFCGCCSRQSVAGPAPAAPRS